MKLRPIVPTDQERVHRAYALLSRESRLNRFWEESEKLNSTRAYILSNKDRETRVGWIALPVDDDSELPGYGAASFWRRIDSPEEAEFSATIIDQFQRSGFGALLLSILWWEAWIAGIRTFTGVARLSNTAIKEWWQSAGGTVTENRSGMGQEMILPLSEPRSFSNQIAFDMHAGTVAGEVASWFSEWSQITGHSPR